MNPIGWCEYESALQASDAMLDALRELAVSLLSDNMARSSGMVALRPFHQRKPMAGTAVTVRTRAGDNLAIHRAFDFCRPGDVLMIDGAGELTQALMGGIMAGYAESLGVQGLVIDGAIRVLLRRTPLSVFRDDSEIGVSDRNRRTGLLPDKGTNPVAHCERPDPPP
jgi:hypothetical protein